MSKENKYIDPRPSGKYRVRFTKSLWEPQHWGTYDTLAEAEAARDQALQLFAEGKAPGNVLKITPTGHGKPRPQVDGLTFDRLPYDSGDLWDLAKRAQDRYQRRIALRNHQSITVPDPDLPFGLAVLSDFHIGSQETDYKALERDIGVIQQTPRLFCGFTGDGIDNWVMDRLQHLQRDQALQFQAEVALFAEVIGAIRNSLLFVVSGTHENWSYRLSGIDRLSQMLQDMPVLYDPFECVFTLAYGPHSIVFKARHQWKYTSVFNQTHSIEVGWQRGDVDFDIGIGAHTHIGTFCRPFVRHKKVRYALLVGTYKVNDRYGRELGLPAPYGVGSGAFVFYPDGRPPEFFNCLQTCADFLGYLGAN